MATCRRSSTTSPNSRPEPAAGEHHDPAAKRRGQPESRRAGLHRRAQLMGRLAAAGRGEGLVDGDRHADGLGPVHPLESDQGAALVGHGEARRHPDMFRTGPGCGDHRLCIGQVQSFDCQHGVLPGCGFSRPGGRRDTAAAPHGAAVVRTVVRINPWSRAARSPRLVHGKLAQTGRTPASARTVRRPVRDTLAQRRRPG